MAKVIKADLVEEVYHNTNLPKQEINVIVDALFAEIKNALCKGNTIELRNFGTFESRQRKGKTNARNPRTGEIVQGESHSVVVFKAGRELKEKIWTLKKSEK
jgi:integration host factor subunit beta